MDSEEEYCLSRHSDPNFTAEDGRQIIQRPPTHVSKPNNMHDDVVVDNRLGTTFSK